MSILDEDKPRKPQALPGESLADLSIDELRARIALYLGEVARLEREIAAKEKSRLAADRFFKS